MKATICTFSYLALYRCERIKLYAQPIYSAFSPSGGVACFQIFTHADESLTSVSLLSNLALQVQNSQTWSNSNLGRFATSLDKTTDSKNNTKERTTTTTIATTTTTSTTTMHDRRTQTRPLTARATQRRNEQQHQQITVINKIRTQTRPRTSRTTQWRSGRQQHQRQY